MVVEQAARLRNEVATGVSRPSQHNESTNYPAQPPVSTAPELLTPAAALCATWSAVSA